MFDLGLNPKEGPQRLVRRVTSNLYPRPDPPVAPGRRDVRSRADLPDLLAPASPAFPASPLQGAIAEIRSTPRSAPAGYRRLMGASLVLQIDEFIGALEEMHLKDGVRVPNSMVARLERFLDGLPADWPTSFPLRTRIAYVLEDLFTLQDYALDLKVSGRRSLRSIDEGADWAAGRDL